MQQQLMVKEGEEVVDSDGEMQDCSNVITLEEIMGNDAPTADQEDDPAYHEEFIRKMRMTEQLQQISKDKNFVNFDEDDDKFFISLDNNGNEG
jgi:hypothetical protein